MGDPARDWLRGDRAATTALISSARVAPGIAVQACRADCVATATRLADREATTTRRGCGARSPGRRGARAVSAVQATDGGLDGAGESAALLRGTFAARCSARVDGARHR